VSLLKFTILILSLAFAFLSVAGFGRPDEWKCVSANPRLAPRFDDAAGIRAAKKEFRRLYGNNVPYCPNYFADVTSLTLSHWEIVSGISAVFETKINIFTEYTDPENDVVTFNYRVSAGKIVGQGARVEWDLSGIAPGVYTIIAGVNDGAGVCGEIKGRRIEILACDTCRLRETE
jgi:hypothetical protein